jgi:RNA polymerase sigma factor for flagellar operon FliA
MFLAVAARVEVTLMEQHSEHYTTPTHWSQQYFENPILGMTRDRDHTLAEHLPTVRQVARSIHKRLPYHVDIDDLINSGVLGLMDAFQKFNPEKCTQFGAFARFRIRGAILDYLRSLDWSPRELRSKRRKLKQADSALTGRYGRTPSESEVATELNMKLSEFQRLLSEINEVEIGSLNVTCPNGSGEEMIAQLPDRSDENPFSQCLRAEIQQYLRDAIEGLPERERLVMLLYYREELTRKEIGMHLGVAESRVSQIHTSAIRRLRVALCMFRQVGKADDLIGRKGRRFNNSSRRRDHCAN